MLASCSGDGAPEKVLDTVRALRASGDGDEGAEAACDLLGDSLAELSKELQTDMHPSLGDLWLEYGDVLLEIVETKLRGIVVRQAQAEVLQETPVVEEDVADDGEEHEADLQMAWECLETARNCLEMRGGAGGPESQAPSDALALTRVHSRLGDLLLLQGRATEAVEEFQAALGLYPKAGAPEPTEDGAETEIKARLAVAQGQAARLAREAEQALAASDAGADAAAPAEAADAGFGPAPDLQGRPVMEVPVRSSRKRPREPEEN